MVDRIFGASCVFKGSHEPPRVKDSAATRWNAKLLRNFCLMAGRLPVADSKQGILPFQPSQKVPSWNARRLATWPAA